MIQYGGAVLINVHKLIGMLISSPKINGNNYNLYIIVFLLITILLTIYLSNLIINEHK